MDETSADGEIRKGFRVTGRVQGVGFRWWTRRTATELGLRGTVRNCSDGSVEVKAAGLPTDVAALERRLQEGPTSARVDGVHPIDPPGELPRDFRIEH